MQSNSEFYCNFNFTTIFIMAKKFKKLKRPPRLYTDKRGRYIRFKGEKIYITSPLTNKQLVRVVINNFEKGKKKKKYEKQKKRIPRTLEATGLSSTFAATDKKSMSGLSELQKMYYLAYQNQLQRLIEGRKYPESQKSQRGTIIGREEDDAAPVAGLLTDGTNGPRPQLSQSGNFPSYPSGINWNNLERIHFQGTEGLIERPLLEKFQKEGISLQKSKAEAEKIAEARTIESTKEALNKTKITKRKLESLGKIIGVDVAASGHAKSEQIEKIVNSKKLSYDELAEFATIAEKLQEQDNFFKKSLTELRADLEKGVKARRSPRINVYLNQNNYTDPVLPEIPDNPDDLIEVDAGNQVTPAKAPTRIPRQQTPAKPSEPSSLQKISRLISSLQPMPSSGPSSSLTIPGMTMSEQQLQLSSNIVKLKRDIIEKDSEINKIRNEIFKLTQSAGLEKDSPQNYDSQIENLNKQLDEYVLEKQRLSSELLAKQLLWDPVGGSGGEHGRGLYDDEIESIMKKYENLGWKGVYSIDELDKIPVSDKMAFILNLDPSTKPGSHWVGVFIDTKKDKSLEYYDPLAKGPPKRFSEDIKRLIDKLDPDVYLKYKINKVKRQSDNTDTCGWHSMKWVMQRLNGVPWVDCSGWSEVAKSEKEIKKFKNSFGYI